MLAIFKKEIQSFFTSPIGYLIIGLFLILNALFLWVFKGQFNIFDYGFSDLSNFFLLTPWVFLFLIPAITMKSFSEERKLGTLELLLIKPISVLKVVMGKFWGAFILCILSVIPTIVYVYTISKLGLIESNYDLGIVLGSYFGLLFLIATYTSTGLFASTLSDNQIISFILSIALCFLIFFGFEAMATLFSDGTAKEIVKSLGAKYHFESIAVGILDTRNIVYFVSLTFFFTYLSVIRLKNITK
ncbi:gliding motility-associated ABC transporter permease subunit GldF [Croceitalea sp. MTPC9]|uniref:gliding motility-associated ABC transporter permease subunit GldF n=1 Tax=unclassified Croceitalea TaxID=2632280 RepID=UPI002B37595B|nr:gliding motility-associated ABC transporter permease subunit GldF [Croceitalea sp. MTPC6]GMN15967.1 gliding motility-associated ABC transporter permease subunit GldF [Croceitalea sp. MTPC9]